MMASEENFTISYVDRTMIIYRANGNEKTHWNIPINPLIVTANVVKHFIQHIKSPRPRKHFSMRINTTKTCVIEIIDDIILLQIKSSKQDVCIVTQTFPIDLYGESFITVFEIISQFDKN